MQHPLHTETLAAYEAHFGASPAVVARAPGRLEVLGNHTDYNEGFVISCAIDRSTWVAAGPAAGDECVLCLAADGTERRFRLAELSTPERGDWANYIKGLVVELQERGHAVAPFQAMVLSDVPMSAGMSSSAALEMSALLALCQLNDVELPAAELARIGQACENRYVGANTGLLDQFTSLMGKANQLVYIDFRTLAVEQIPCPEEAAFVVANSGVKHDLTQDYNERRERCEEAAAVLARLNPRVRKLRDVSTEELNGARDQMAHLAWCRARHITGENERVQAGLTALQAGDLEAFGRLLYESHQSSRDYFENSCPELDILVETAKSLGALGARLSGGGFGGISIHLVERDEAELYRQRLATAFQSRTGRKLETMICTIGEGAHAHVR